MVWGSGCAGVAVPFVTSMWTRKGRIMSIPIKQGGDSSPTMTMKLALPRAFAPLNVQMLRPTCYIQRFPMCTMDCALERLECPPLGAVAPPYGKAKARNRGSSVY